MKNSGRGAIEGGGYKAGWGGSGKEEDRSRRGGSKEKGEGGVAENRGRFKGRVTKDTGGTVESSGWRGQVKRERGEDQVRWGEDQVRWGEVQVGIRRLAVKRGTNYRRKTRENRLRKHPGIE